MSSSPCTRRSGLGAAPSVRSTGAARSFAASLKARGVGPGDVVVFQLPNWVEAAITFWGAAQLGAIVVPIVHFYGPKEVGYVLDVVQPDAVVTAARFGQTDYLATYETLLREPRGHAVVRRRRRGGVPSRSRPPFRRAARDRTDRGPAPDRPGLAGRHRVHVGDDPEPQGRHPLAPDARLRGPSVGRDGRHRHARHPHGRSRRTLHRHAQRAAPPPPPRPARSKSSTSGIPARCCAS